MAWTRLGLGRTLKGFSRSVANSSFFRFDDVFVAVTIHFPLEKGAGGGGGCSKNVVDFEYPVLFIVDCAKSLSFPNFHGIFAKRKEQ